MAILKIAKLGHPALLKKTNEISNLNDIDLKKIIYDMSETMIDANGIGLAAPQVHLSHRLFIYRNPVLEEEENNLSSNILPSPKNISYSSERNGIDSTLIKLLSSEQACTKKKIKKCSNFSTL